MTILVDSRVGSKHLAPLIRGSELTQLEYGDAAFSSADGRLIGVEVKRVNDAVQCMYTGRLADHQIPGLRAAYDVVYLIVEGVYRPDPDSGVLQLWREFDSSKPVKCGQWYDVATGRKRLMYSAFECWLSSVTLLSGTLVRNTSCATGTAAFLSALYSWYQRENHESMNVLHYADGAGATLSRPTMNRRIYALLPHVGWDRSAVYAKRFPTVADAVRARPEEWFIKGQIAEKSAEDIVRSLNDKS